MPKTETRTRPVTPIGSAKSARTKPAEPDDDGAAEDLDDLPERPSIVSPGKLLGGVALMGFLLYLGYSWLGVPHVAGSGVLGALLGFVVVAAIAYVAALVFLHIVHVHHAAIGVWLARGAGRCLTWAGKRGERLLTSVYVRIGAAAVPAWAWVRGLFDRDGQDQDDDAAAEDGPESAEAELDRLYEAIRVAWCEPIQPGFMPRLVRTAEAQFNAHLSETIAAAVDNDRDGALRALSAKFGARVWIDGYQEPDGFRLRLSVLPEYTPTKDPADAPAPAEPAGASVPAEPNGDTTVTTTTEGRRSGGRIGRVPPEGRAMINMVDDAVPDTDEDHLDLLRGIATFLHDFGQAMQDYHDRCTEPGVRLGKGAVTAGHDAANGIVDAADAVTVAAKSFANYYQGVSDEVAEGVQLPEHGDFITGNGAEA
jgi:hypothetical protein